MLNLSHFVDLASFRFFSWQLKCGYVGCYPCCAVFVNGNWNVGAFAAVHFVRLLLVVIEKLVRFLLSVL